MLENEIKNNDIGRITSERVEIEIKKNQIMKSYPISYAFKKIKKEFDSPAEDAFNPYNPYELGEIEKAEKHKSANRPLRKVTQIDNIEDFVELCPCCQLPIMKKGFLEPFKICDDPKDFSIYGIGVSLYFSSIKFIIFIMFFVSICIGSLNIYYSYKYTNELVHVCNIYFRTMNMTDQNYTEECKYYYTEKDEYFEYFEIYSLANTFFFRFSSVNTKDYRDLYHKINSEKNISFEPSIINISLVNFICLFIVFLFNLFSIFYLYNKTNFINTKNQKLSDYSFFLYNLDGIQNPFNETLKEINHQKQRTIKEGGTFKEELINNSKLGFVPKENMLGIEKFKEFILHKICKSFSETYLINNIVLCYELKKLMKLKEKLEEKKEKLAKIENDPKQKAKNEELKLEGDKRKYFEIFLCCTKTIKFKKLEKQKERILKKINLLAKDSEEHTLKHFIGSAIVTFNSINDKELSLKKIPNNFISYFIGIIKDICSKISSYFKHDNEKRKINDYKRNIKY